jgi:hypothetical protein
MAAPVGRTTSSPEAIGFMLSIMGRAKRTLSVCRKAGFGVEKFRP